MRRFGTQWKEMQTVARYILQRLGQTLLILLIVSFITYLLIDFLPGDPIAAMLGGEIWLGILLMYIFTIVLKWLPSSGWVWPWEDFGESVRRTIMPLTCLTIGGIASITRQTRSSMLEVIRQDYIRTAKSKGLKGKKVIYIHALKNALLPVITLMGLRMGGMLGGSVFVENVFVIPGMGSLLVNAISMQDIPLIQGCVLLIALFTSVVNLITDIIYVLVDPRIKIA